MPPEAPIHAVTAAVAPPAITDWSRRADPADLPEWMDGPCTYEEFRACVRDIGAVNRWTLGFRPTMRFLRQVQDARGSRKSPLRVVDVGSGGGDVLRLIARWATRHGRTVELTGIDLNPYATRAAAELSAAQPRYKGIRWLTGDALDHPQTQDCDVALSTLVTHHMRDAEIVAFLRWMEFHAASGWFINDLRRSARASRLFSLLGGLMRWHPFVRHDGPVSFRRAFRSEDWHRLLAQAGIPAEAVRLSQPAPGRLCVTRLR